MGGLSSPDIAAPPAEVQPPAASSGAPKIEGTSPAEIAARDAMVGRVDFVLGGAFNMFSSITTLKFFSTELPKKPPLDVLKPILIL